jgi:hypothetical protein
MLEKVTSGQGSPQEHLTQEMARIWAPIRLAGPFLRSLIRSGNTERPENGFRESLTKCSIAHSLGIPKFQHLGAIYIHSDTE